MSPVPAPAADSIPEPTLPNGPPDEAFWEKYNGRFECALGSAISVFLHVAVALLLWGVLGYIGSAAGGKDAVPVTFVDYDGTDDTGRGSASDGGNMNALAMDGSPQEATESTLKTPDLPNVQQPTPPSPNRLTDPNAPAPISASNFAESNATPSPKVGSKGNPGTTTNTGTGQAGAGGKGPGGTGDDATQRRGDERWVLNFSYSSEGTPRAKGQAFLDELAGFGGTIVMYKPGSAGSRQCYVYSDFLRSKTPEVMTENEVERKYSGWKAFSNDPKASARDGDARGARKAEETNQEVSLALGLDFTPDKFAGRFKPELQKMLTDKEEAFLARARSETQFSSLRVPDLKRTVFAVDRQRPAGDQVYVSGVRLNDNTTEIHVMGGRLLVRRR